jgi:hypothetical protein
MRPELDSSSGLRFFLSGEGADADVLGPDFSRIIQSQIGEIIKDQELVRCCLLDGSN